jgi:hypothetical protein
MRGVIQLKISNVFSSTMQGQGRYSPKPLASTAALHDSNSCAIST